MASQFTDGNIYIGGEWQRGESDSEIRSENPADPGETVGTYPSGTRGDAEGAIEAAVGAQESWAARSSHDRGAYLRDAADVIEAQYDDVVEVVVRECGKTRSSAAGEVTRTIDLLNYYAEVARDYGGDAPHSSDADTLTYTTREPWGTAALITPWNFPIAIPTWKLAPALVAGNTAVLKPASATPMTAAVLIDAFEEVGLPDGVLNFVTGSGSTVGDELVTSDGTDVVSFTGSYEIGSDVAAAAQDRDKRVQCEMGGKNPLIVDDSADLDRAVDLTIAGGMTGLAGQACTATSRAIVFESVADEYVDRLVAAVEDLQVGAPLDPETDMGPKYAESGLEVDLEYIDVGVNEGATLATGGNELDREGYFVEPTVFTDVDPDMRIAQEEIFGPVVSVIEVADYPEAIEVANGVEYGLSASLCTNQLDRTQAFVDDIETGVVKINQTTTGVEMQMPFGGRKHSSTETFKEQGRQGIDFYSHEKAVYITP